MSDPKRRRVQFAEPDKEADQAKPSAATQASAPDVLQELERKARAKQAQPRTLLPGEDEEDEEERGFQRSDVGPIKDFDPEHAAKRRAALRATQRRRGSVHMEVSVVPTAAAGEEDYEDPEEEFLTGNIPVEPFHLRREREEGFFDDAGNYVQYRAAPDDVADAWVDALDDLDPNQRVEGELATRLLAAAAAGGQITRNARKGGAAGPAGEGSRGDEDAEEDVGGDVEDDQGGLKLTQQELAAYKQRMTALMQPGETVLAALRRLAGPSTAGPAGTAGAQAHGATAVRQRARKQQLKAGAGDQAPVKPGGTGGSGTGAMDVDVPRTSTTTPTVQSRKDQPCTDSPGSQSQPTRAQPSRPARAVLNPEFDKLTELADSLLGAGQFNVYSHTREQLLTQAGARPHGAASRTAALQQRSAPDRGAQLAAALLRAAEADAVAGHGSATTNAAPSEATDMPTSTGTGQERPNGGQQAAGGGNAGVVPSDAQLLDELEELDEGDGAADRQRMTTGASTGAQPAGGSAANTGLGCQGGEAGAGVLPIAGSGGLSTAPAEHARTGPASEPQAAGPGSGPAASSAPDAMQLLLQGFEATDQAGHFYSSSLGLWYRQADQLFMDASNGVWHRYAPAAAGDGRDFQEVPEAGRGLQGSVAV